MITIPLLIICAVSVYLVMCPYYKDGLFGRMALAVLSISAAVGAYQFWEGDIDFNPVSENIIVALAVLHMRKTYHVVCLRFGKEYSEKL